MGDNGRYGNAVDYDVDLHSVYAAYLGQFESAGTEWWDRSWGGYFGTFNDFLSFGWDVMIVVDSVTGRAHIAVRRDQIGLFAKMIRTRFGETLSKDPPTTLPLSPVPTRTLSLRRLITLSDLAAYRKLALSLPAAELSNLRTRARAGDVGLAEQLFYAGGEAGEREKGNVGVRDNGMGYTWACIKTTWWEKGGAPGGIVPGQGRVNGGREGAQMTGPQGTNGAGGLAGGGGGHKGKSGGLVLEVGMAVLRCAHLRGVDVWPPVPGENYRKSHYIIEEWVDKRTNTNPPSYPRAYAFGKSQWIPEKSLERILDANLGALSSQENDSSPNTLVLLCIGEPAPITLPTWTTLPNNIINLDVLALEYNLLRRAQDANIPGTPDRSSPLPSLAALLQTLQIPVPPFAPLGNAGNEAYYTLLAFQKLMMAETRLPDVLFSQPDYGMMMNSPSYVGMNGMGSMTNLSMVGAGMGSYFPNSNSMLFGTPHQHLSQDFGLPPPQAPFANTTHSRRRSGSSNRRSTSTGEMLPPGLPATYSHGGAGTGNGSGSGSGSRNGSPVGGYSPVDSPRRNGGGLPFAGSSIILRRGSETVLANSQSQSQGQGATRSRPTSVPHRSSFEIPSQPSSGSVERDRSMPPKSALRGSSTNIANGGYSNGSPGVGARTVSWSGPPPEVESHDVISSNSRGSNGNPNGTALSSSAGATSAKGYVNGHGNTYSPNITASRSPPMMAAARSRSSDYFHSSSMKNVNENEHQSRVDLAEEPDEMQLNSTSKRNSRLSLSSGRRMSSYHLEQGGMASSGSAGMENDVESGSGVGNGISNQANASTSTASIPSGIRPSSTHQSSMNRNRQGMANRADSGSGNGSTGTGSASGSGIPSVPSLPSGGSLSRTDLAYSAKGQSHPLGQGTGTLNGKAKERMMSRSNLSSMVNGNGNVASRVDVSDKLGDGKGSIRKKDKDAKNKSKDKDKDKEGKKDKDKEGKGMKNVAGALARFWVG